MEIKLNIKTPGKADVNFEFSCTEQETAMLIQDPVYQDFGKVLVNHIKWESEQCWKQKADDLRRLHTQQQKHNENLRRQVEVMQHAMTVLEKRIESFKKRNPDF